MEEEFVMLSRTFAVVLIPFLLGHAVASTAVERPNLIVILTDDQGYHDVGFNGCEDIPTPHIDRLADEGVLFTNGYVTESVCGPSRAGLLTGRYQGRFGFNDNPSVDPSNPDIGIPLEEKTIAEHLKTVGYRSKIVGKWHMGSHPQHHPMRRGFDEFFGFLAGGRHYLPEEIYLDDFSDVTRNWDWYNMKLIDGYDRVGIDEYLTDAFSNEAVRFVEESAKHREPFFLYLAYNAPHGPLEATEKYLSRFSNIEDLERRTYAAMVSAVDDGVGRVLQALEKQGLSDDTLVVFLSDNGGSLKNASSNEPLRGHKGRLWEGGVRVPFAMRWPGTIPQGVVREDPVISLDILATIAEHSGVLISPERPLDGIDLLPYLRGEVEALPNRQLTWRSGSDAKRFAIRQGDWKLVRTVDHERGPSLHNLANDLSEQRDLGTREFETAAALSEDWEEWASELEPTAFPTLGKDKWWLRSE
ncbi:sulfatase-like hydrolase/transferase [Puniceicoccaceae bacterium K14]|nr:sulfatase-like hydrolase/transferase [Puniceicoccaceae bacterium K14]